MSRELAIVIPAFNEEGALPDLMRELFESDFRPDQIVVINDASKDRTAEVAAATGVHVVNLHVNLGIGGAVQTGYRWALERGFEYAVQLDGDGQHIPATLHTLLETARRTRAQLVIGSRFSGEASEFRSTWLRRVGIRWFSTLIRLLTGQRYHDTTSGLRLAHVDLYRRFAAAYPVDYPEPETLAWAAAKGFPISEVAVPMRVRVTGNSSITNLWPLYYMFKVTAGILLGTLNRWSRA